MVIYILDSKPRNLVEAGTIKLLLPDTNCDAHHKGLWVYLRYPIPLAYNKLNVRLSIRETDRYLEMLPKQ